MLGCIEEDNPCLMLGCRFVAGTVADKAPIIPISAVLKYNIDVICEYLCTKIPVPVRDFTSKPHMIVIRSFDVNKPGSYYKDGLVTSRCTSKLPLIL